MNKRFAIFLWGYVVEFVLAAVMTILIFAIWSPSVVNRFLGLTMSDWLTISGQALFPAGIAIWLTYINLESDDFGAYLHYAGMDKSYSFAFVFPSIVFFVTTLTLIGYKGEGGASLLYLVIFMLNYSLVAMITMIGNAGTIIRLHRKFKIEITDKK